MQNDKLVSAYHRGSRVTVHVGISSPHNFSFAWHQNTTATASALDDPKIETQQLLQHFGKKITKAHASQQTKQAITHEILAQWKAEAKDFKKFARH